MTISMRYKFKIIYVAAFILSIFCSGCTSTEIPPIGTVIGRTVQIYLLDDDKVSFMPVDRDLIDGDAVTQAYYLVNLLADDPADAVHASPFTVKTELIDCKVNRNTLLLYFDRGYARMDTISRTLCDAALAKTLTQINGIEYIRIYSGYVSITDGRGNQVGRISGGDYADSISDVNAFTSSEIVLYFADESGKLLVPESRKVVYNMNTSLERKVVEELIKGPVSGLSKLVLLPTVRLISISTSNGVCYVNLNEDFMTAVTDVDSRIPVYAIVDSLTSLPYISKVQIMVDSAQNIAFMGDMPLNRSYERDESIISPLYETTGE